MKDNTIIKKAEECQNQITNRDYTMLKFWI